MRNNKKKPSVFTNVLIIMGCTMFAAFYVMALRMCIGGFTHGTQTESTQAEQFAMEEETLPAWAGRAEPEEETLPDTIGQQPRLKKDSGRTKTEDSGTGDAKAEDGAAEEETEQTEETVGEAVSEEQETKEAGRDKMDGKRIQVGDVQTIQQAGTANAIVTDVTQVVNAAMPCVVAITNEYTAYDFWYDEEYEDKANGSGIIISQNNEELLILTNYHVVEDANELYVKFIDDTEVVAYVKGIAPEEDLSVVSVFLSDVPDTTLERIALAALGDSDVLNVGEPAIAIGNSLGYGQSVTTGVISALNCDIFEDDEEISLSSLIQTDAAINPGNSGGALLNVHGEVIGINSSKIADYAIEGMGYAIPINTAKPIVDELVQKETRRKVDPDKRAFLGISGADVSQEAVASYDMCEGVYVSNVLDGTAAEEAGIRKGDIITAIDDTKVDSMTALQNMLDYYEAGTDAEITVMRMKDGGYEEMRVQVTFGLKED